MTSPQRKNAVITGATSGIGLSITNALARDGCNIILLGRRQETLEKKQRELESHFPDQWFCAVVMDLSDAKSVDSAAEHIGDIVRDSRGVHYLVNCAGMIGGRVNAVEADVSTWERVMMVNLVNQMRLTQRMLRHMVTRHDARGRAIVNISSISGKTTTGSNNAQYTASKHGMCGFSATLFEDVRHHGIKVISICPGFVNTPMVSDRDNLESEKMIQPDDLAEVVVFAIHAPQSLCIQEMIIRPQLPPIK